MKFTYAPKGICARQINVEIENDIIKNVEFIGGCNGNTKGISAIVKNMHIDDVISKFNGITCANKPSSCPDQLAKALQEAKEKL